MQYNVLRIRIALRMRRQIGNVLERLGMNNSVRTTAMTIRIEADLLNALKKVCNDKGYSQSFVVRELLKDYVKNNAQKELFDFEGGKK